MAEDILPLASPFSFFYSPDFQAEEFALPEPVKAEVTGAEIEIETSSSGWLALAALAGLAPWGHKTPDMEDRKRRPRCRLC
jgi:hypothetical protein